MPVPKARILCPANCKILHMENRGAGSNDYQPDLTGESAASTHAAELSRAYGNSNMGKRLKVGKGWWSALIIAARIGDSQGESPHLDCELHCRWESI